MTGVFIDPGDVDLAGRAMLGAVDVLSRARARLADDLDTFLADVGHQAGMASIDLVARTEAVIHVLDGLGRACESDGHQMQASAARARAADVPIRAGVETGVGDELGIGQRWWNRAVESAVPVVVDDVYGAASLGRAVFGVATDPAESLDWVLGGRSDPGSDPTDGDLGGTYQTRRVEGFPGPAAGNPTDRGRESLSYFLAETSDIQRHDTADPQIRDDEFEIIDHGGNAYTVVLPGVTDLSRPQPGLDPTTATVRDLDQFSIPSAIDTRKESNRYALMVEQGLQSAGVPVGANLVIVGHSFGADTALDLAADPIFNGRTYEVSHVVAAGYHSQPQLEHIPGDTKVLVLQNRFDVAVRAESLLDTLTFDSPTKGDHQAIVDVFTGGLSGGGHHQRHYVDHVDRTHDATVSSFLASLDASGHTRTGTGIAVDVSVPARGPNSDP